MNHLRALFAILILMSYPIPCCAQDTPRVQSDSLDVSFKLTGKKSVSRSHKDSVHVARFSNDGTRLVSGGNDGQIKIWRVRTLTKPTVILKHKQAVLDIAYQDNLTFLSSSDDGTIRGWADEQVDERFTIRPNSGYISMVCSLQDRIWYVSAEGCFRWSVSGREKLFDGATAIALSHDGRFVSVAISSGEIKILSPSTSAVSQETQLVEGDIPKRPSHLSWSPKGDYISAVTWMRTTNELYLYNLANNTTKHVAQPHSPSISEAKFTPDGRFVICAGYNLSIVDVESCQSHILAVPPAESETILNSFSASPRYFTCVDVMEIDGTTKIVAGTADGDIIRWTLAESRSKGEDKLGVKP